MDQSPNPTDTSLNVQSLFPIHWKQGQHLTVIGDTGSGKTFLLSRLVQMRQYVVVLRTKPDDIVFEGFQKFRTAKSMQDVHNERILLEPDYKKQAIEGFTMLEKAWQHGGWTIVIDEHWYSERLGLKPYIERLLTQGRSKGISVVTGMQRPVLVSRFTLSQSEHIISFRLEPRDLRTLAEATTDRLVAPISALGQYEFAYFNRSSRAIAKGTAKTLGRILIP
jgi:ABC-type dipeptide/oligopeptide/nickel transport system ATPase component